MTSNQKNWSVFLGTIAASGICCAAWLGAMGVTEDHVLVVLRWSARAAFVLLMLVFVARPLQQLLRRPWTATLLRNRRLLGIAFAGMHTAHLGLIFYRSRISDEFVFRAADNLPGTLTYTVILAMLATSWDAPTKRLGRRNWKLLHTAGLYFLFVAFTAAVGPESIESAQPVNWLLAGIAVAALFVRLLAFARSRQRTAAIDDAR